MIWRLKEIVTRKKFRLISNYQRKGEDLKLHIGAGLNTLNGWINTDIYANKQNLYLNLTKPMKFSDSLFRKLCKEFSNHHKLAEPILLYSYKCLSKMKTGRILS